MSNAEVVSPYRVAVLREAWAKTSRIVDKGEALALLDEIQHRRRNEDAVSQQWFTSGWEAALSEVADLLLAQGADGVRAFLAEQIGEDQ